MIHTVELPAKIDKNHKIHLHVQLPESITAKEAKVIVIYEEKKTQPSKKIKYDLFKGKIKMSPDFNDPLPDNFWLEGKI